MSSNYCRSCYRAMSSDSELCPACEVAGRRGPRGVTALGVIGVPILIVGILTFNVRLCVAGAIVAGAAALLHVVLALR